MKLLPSGGPERRRLIGMILLLGILLAILWERMPTTPSTVPETTPSRTTGASVPGAAMLPAPLKIEMLAGSGQQPVVGRNPFMFGTRPAPPAPPPPVVRAPMPAPPPVPQGPPPIGLKLAGLTVLPNNGGTVATLKDPESGAIFNAIEGAVLDGRYKLVKVGLQSVIVSYLDGSGTRTIPLGG